MAQLRRLLGRADGRADRAPAPEGPPAPERDPAAPLPSFSPLSTLLNTAGPASCDALTQLSGVDETVQAHLYEHGVTRFEQIARWSSADVRRISESLGIDRRLIQDRWIIEAQSYLYERNHSL